MNQKTIREHNGNDYTVAEAAEWLKELDDRTKSSKTPYNSIDKIASVLKDEFKINISNGANYFKAIKIPNTPTGAYRDKLILLLPKITTPISVKNKILGRLIAEKSGANLWDTFDISAQSVWNTTVASFVSSGRKPYHKLVTCTYNGVEWIALKFDYEANTYTNYFFKGFHIVDSSVDPNNDSLKVIEYYKRAFSGNPAEVLITEVNNSIQDYTSLYPFVFSSKMIVNGDITCTSLIQTSDKKYKKNIEEIDGKWALEVFKKLNFSFYDFSKTNSKQAGLIAQEVEKILPQAVHTSENGDKGLNHTYIDMICKAGIQHFIKTQIQ